MADLLLAEFPDGAFFHAYHAFECVVCSKILQAAPGRFIPVGHADKLDQLMDLLGQAPLADRVAALWTDLDRAMNESLYVGWRADVVRTPGDVFHAEPVGDHIALHQGVERGSRSASPVTTGFIWVGAWRE